MIANGRVKTPGLTKNRALLLLAQGFGSGRCRPGPGTWGSVVGLGWTWLLLLPGCAICFYAGAFVAAAVAVWVCGEAERILGQHDPGSVVLDEIVAIPCCFMGALAARTWRGGFPGGEFIGDFHPWWLVPAGFVLFRIFDIAKPWPVRQVQVLPRGWGIVADDLVAAVWVNLALLPFVV